MWVTLPVCPASRGPDEIRTHNGLNANQVLYQLELRAHNAIFRRIVNRIRPYVDILKPNHRKLSNLLLRRGTSCAILCIFRVT